MDMRSALAAAVILQAAAFGQNPATLRVEGLSGSAATLSLADFAKLSPASIMVTEHGKPAVFEGVPLVSVLGGVTTPSGEAFHHTAASYYLVAEGRDGYQVVLAWAELDPSFTDKSIWVVTKRDGKPLSERDGPFQLVVPGDKSPARWVRQLTRLRVESAAGTPSHTP
jgi:hypothetical protein